MPLSEVYNEYVAEAARMFKQTMADNDENIIEAVRAEQSFGGARMLFTGYAESLRKDAESIGEDPYAIAEDNIRDIAKLELDETWQEVFDLTKDLHARRAKRAKHVA